MNYSTKIIMVTAASFIIGTASIAFAQEGPRDPTAPGKMHSYMQQRGMGKFHGGTGMLPAANALSEEQIKKLEALRTEFRDETLDLRQELRSKTLALKSELAKKTPDAKTARTLQKDISALNTELGQKRIEHILEMKKIAPYGRMGHLGEKRERLRGGRLRQM